MLRVDNTERQSIPLFQLQKSSHFGAEFHNNGKALMEFFSMTTEKNMEATFKRTFKEPEIYDLLNNFTCLEQIIFLKTQ